MIHAGGGVRLLHHPRLPLQLLHRRPHTLPSGLRASHAASALSCGKPVGHHLLVETFAKIYQGQHHCSRRLCRDLASPNSAYIVWGWSPGDGGFAAHRRALAVVAAVTLMTLWRCQLPPQTKPLIPRGQGFRSSPAVLGNRVRKHVPAHDAGQSALLKSRLRWQWQQLLQRGSPLQGPLRSSSSHLPFQGWRHLWRCCCLSLLEW